MKCNHCHEDIESDAARFFIGYWPQGLNSRKMPVKNYHAHCFKEFAGDEYVKEVSGLDPSEENP